MEDSKSNQYKRNKRSKSSYSDEDEVKRRKSSCTRKDNNDTHRSKSRQKYGSRSVSQSRSRSYTPGSRGSSYSRSYSRSRSRSSNSKSKRNSKKARRSRSWSRSSSGSEKDSSRSLVESHSSRHSQERRKNRDPRDKSKREVWKNKVYIVGEIMRDQTFHFCDSCQLPIYIYCRLIPCKHIFCNSCGGKYQDKKCPRCEKKVNMLERCNFGSIFMCYQGGSTHSSQGCRRTYLSQRDLESHINHRHTKSGSGGLLPLPHQNIVSHHHIQQQQQPPPQQTHQPHLSSSTNPSQSIMSMPSNLLASSFLNSFSPVGAANSNNNVAAAAAAAAHHQFTQQQQQQFQSLLQQSQQQQQQQHQHQQQQQNNSSNQLIQSMSTLLAGITNQAQGMSRNPVQTSFGGGGSTGGGTGMSSHMSVGHNPLGGPAQNFPMQLNQQLNMMHCGINQNPLSSMMGQPNQMGAAGPNSMSGPNNGGPQSGPGNIFMPPGTGPSSVAASNPQLMAQLTTLIQGISQQSVGRQQYPQGQQQSSRTGPAGINPASWTTNPSK